MANSNWLYREPPAKHSLQLKYDWEEEQFVDYFDPENDCPRCRGSGQVPTESYESYFGDNYKPCPVCFGR